MSEQIKTLPDIERVRPFMLSGRRRLLAKPHGATPGEGIREGSPTRIPAPRYVGDVGDSAVGASRSKGGCSLLFLARRLGSRGLALAPAPRVARSERTREDYAVTILDNPLRRAVPLPGILEHP